MKIFIDAGHNHSGADTGAQGNGLREQDITYQVAQKVGDRLKNEGITIKYSRNNITDNVGSTVNESINGRVKMANSWGADCFISIHCNAAAPSANGTETLIYAVDGKAEQLAKAVNARLSGLGLKDRGIKVRTDLGVLKYTNMSAVLVELAFITNAGDAVWLRDRQDELAQAIANGVFKFLGIEVNNMLEEITTVEQALDKIISKGVDTDKAFWIKACDYDTYLDKLLIKIANKMR